jgi:hypothetical protein
MMVKNISVILLTYVCLPTSCPLNELCIGSLRTTSDNLEMWNRTVDLLAWPWIRKKFHSASLYLQMRFMPVCVLFSLCFNFSRKFYQCCFFLSVGILSWEWGFQKKVLLILLRPSNYLILCMHFIGSLIQIHWIW